MMLRELRALLDAHAATADAVRSLVLDANVLSKRTGSARRLALKHLRALYGIGTASPVALVLERLWQRDATGRPLLALLCALARDPLLRDSGDVVLPVAAGTPLRWPTIAAHFDGKHPGRFSDKMLRSLSQNCASSWTQSGHLRGKVSKVRARAAPTGIVAAYAALLATFAGFGGPALLDSPWLKVLDREREERLSLLRQAEGQGLVRVRVASEMIEVGVRKPMARALGMPHLAGLR
jgi:hypothetical protein